VLASNTSRRIIVRAIRHLCLSVLAVFVVGGFGAAAASGASAGCSEQSWVAGTVDLCSGTLVYRDYVYDDYGADTGEPVASSTGPLARPTGDVRYERDVNSADLVALRLRIKGNRLEASFELNTLRSADSTVAALAIDTDDNRATTDGASGSKAWGSLGVSSAGWDVLALFDRGDPETNRIEGSIPLPAGSRWRVQAVTAVKGGPVMNVAFRGADEKGRWWEDLQAAALAPIPLGKGGDISSFGHQVDVADMRTRVTRPAEVGPGLHERVYESRYTASDVTPAGVEPAWPSEGMSYEGLQVRDAVFPQLIHFYGKYQPYGVYLPSRPGPHGVQLILHANWSNHLSLLANAGLRRRLGEEVNRIIVAPLGRGASGWYSGLSERDVLDVLDDVETTYDVDRDRIFGGGYSMGGYGTFRLVALHPDRFAGWITWVAPVDGDCLVGTETNSCPYFATDASIPDLVGNFRHVPGAMLYAGADWGVLVNQAAVIADAFRSHDFPYVFYMHPLAEHLTFSVTDDWRKEAAYTAALERQKRPARVTFRTDPRFGNGKLGLAHDRAYWVSQIAGREGGYRDVDLRTLGCGGTIAETAPALGAGIDPVPWVSESRQVIGVSPVEQANRIDGTLSNVASLMIDVEAACLASAPLAYRIATDGAATLRFTDGRVLELPSAGTHEGVLGS
jgi:pimeloyl-ACP methyl ester carboxylesterase